MKFKFLLLLIFSFSILSAQENPNPLPKGMTDFERKLVNDGEYQPPKSNLKGIQTPPNFPTRTIGEWEELRAIVLVWDAYFSTLRDIAKFAAEEVEVINVCQDSTSLKLQMTVNGISLENQTFIEAPFNTVWVRDYGPNPVYQNDVDSLVLIDWIYNRPRDKDDVIPDIIGEYLGVPVYSMVAAPNDLVHTGGNFMADGLGTGFSSELVLEENQTPNQYGTSNHSEEDVENLMNLFMGIEQYPKMNSLLYDGINHVDMHMKLLDEQTWLIGEFPEGVSDGPQIEANIQFVLDNYQTFWGTDFKVERIVQPPCGNGNYPPSCGGWGAEYRTYTNALFVNKMVLVPTYNNTPEMNVEALERWQELMPGYKIRGIDCTQIIDAGGAIHCITKEIGVADPLWIAHRELDNVPAAENTGDYFVEAKIKHRSGISEATLYWTIDTTQAFQPLTMSISNVDEDLWAANIPNQELGTHIYYYIEGASNSGKMTVRPLPAPAGYFDFQVGDEVGTAELEKFGSELAEIYPNPASAITVISINSEKHQNIQLTLKDVLGKTVEIIFEGEIEQGERNFFIHANHYPKGTYFVHLGTDNHQQTQKLIIH